MRTENLEFRMEELLNLLSEFSSLSIADQIDYKKFYLYSIITHSTAIEGSTVTEIENQLLFDQGISASKRTMAEQLMNLDLKAAYEKSIQYAEQNEPYSVEMLKLLSSLVMKNTGSVYNSINGSFDARNGDLRLVNVSAGVGGKSYMAFQKVPAKLEEFCEWLNKAISKINKNDMIEAYKLSFEAHYRLVVIHPWVDAQSTEGADLNNFLSCKRLACETYGNGRMSRLVMNQVQTQLGLLPTIVYKEHKAEYIESLAKSESAEDSSLFIDFMFDELKAFLEENIANFKKSMDNNFIGSNKKDSDLINDPINKMLALIEQNPNFSYDEYAEKIGKSPATVKRMIQELKAQDKIERIGAKKNGYWKIIEN